jgi:hypothetical protein
VRKQDQAAGAGRDVQFALELRSVGRDGDANVVLFGWKGIGHFALPFG